MKKLITAALLLASSSIFADAFDDDLKELFELTGLVNNYIGVNTFIINRMQDSYFQAVDSSIDASLYTEKQKEQAGEILKDRFTRMVKSYELHVEKVMSYDKVIEEVYLPLYKESYSSSEVKELLNFYRSPVGKKSLVVAQKISDEASARVAEKYDPVVVPFMEEQIEENVAIAIKEIESKVK